MYTTKCKCKPRSTHVVNTCAQHTYVQIHLVNHPRQKNRWGPCNNTGMAPDDKTHLSNEQCKIDFNIFFLSVELTSFSKFHHFNKNRCIYTVCRTNASVIISTCSYYTRYSSQSNMLGMISWEGEYDFDFGWHLPKWHTGGPLVSQAKMSNRTDCLDDQFSASLQILIRAIGKIMYTTRKLTWTPPNNDGFQ